MYLMLTQLLTFSRQKQKRLVKAKRPQVFIKIWILQVEFLAYLGQVRILCCFLFLIVWAKNQGIIFSQWYCATVGHSRLGAQRTLSPTQTGSIIWWKNPVFYCTTQHLINTPQRLAITINNTACSNRELSRARLPSLRKKLYTSSLPLLLRALSEDTHGQHQPSAPFADTWRTV